MKIQHISDGSPWFSVRNSLSCIVLAMLTLLCMNSHAQEALVPEQLDELVQDLEIDRTQLSPFESRLPAPIVRKSFEELPSIESSSVTQAQEARGVGEFFGRNVGVIDRRI
jgi:hypothetical protein